MPTMLSKPLPSSAFALLKTTNRLEAIREDAPSKASLFERVFAGKAPPRAAIKAFCLECLQFSDDAIKTCTAPACPLFQYRPFQKARKS